MIEFQTDMIFFYICNFKIICIFKFQSEKLKYWGQRLIKHNECIDKWRKTYKVSKTVSCVVYPFYRLHCSEQMSSIL